MLRNDAHEDCKPICSFGSQPWHTMTRFMSFCVCLCSDCNGSLGDGLISEEEFTIMLEDHGWGLTCVQLTNNIAAKHVMFGQVIWVGIKPLCYDQQEPSLQHSVLCLWYYRKVFHCWGVPNPNLQIIRFKRDTLVRPVDVILIWGPWFLGTTFSHLVLSIPNSKVIFAPRMRKSKNIWSPLKWIWMILNGKVASTSLTALVRRTGACSGVPLWTYGICFLFGLYGCGMMWV